MSNAGDERFDYIRRTYPPLVRTKEALEILRVSQRTLERLRRQGHLHAVTLPTVNRVYFLLEDVISLIQIDTFPSKAWRESPFGKWSADQDNATKDDNGQPEL